MKNNLSESTKISLPMTIAKENDTQYSVFCPVENLNSISYADTFEEAVKEARAILLFHLSYYLDENIPIPVVTENDLLRFEKEKEENETIILIEETSENIIEEFKDSVKVNS